MRTTHTFAILPVSLATYREIADKLQQAGYDHAIFEDEKGSHVIDMHGIALEVEAAVPTKTREGDQPLPTKNNLPFVHDLMKADVEARKRIGEQRYGTPLQPHNGRDVLKDIYEELLDAAVYLRQQIYERDHPKESNVAESNI